MSMKTMEPVFVVRTAHPRFPSGTIIYKQDLYELPDGTLRRLSDDGYLNKLSPPTNRAKLSKLPNYPG